MNSGFKELLGALNEKGVEEIEGIPVSYLGRDDLIRSREIADRHPDRSDIRKLRGPGSGA